MDQPAPARGLISFYGLHKQIQGQVLVPQPVHLFSRCCLTIGLYYSMYQQIVECRGCSEALGSLAHRYLRDGCLLVYTIQRVQVSCCLALRWPRSSGRRFLHDAAVDRDILVTDYTATQICSLHQTHRPTTIVLLPPRLQQQEFNIYNHNYYRQEATSCRSGAICDPTGSGRTSQGLLSHLQTGFGGSKYV